MKITVYLLIILSVLVIQCTSPEVSAVKDSSIYSIDDGAFYLRKITINGDRIYIVVNEKGQVISGTSSAQKQGKTVSYVSSIVP